VHFVRILRFAGNGAGADTFGPYDDYEAAAQAVQEWGSIQGITLYSGLPFPRAAFWADSGSILIYIEPGQGRGSRKLLE